MKNRHSSNCCKPFRLARVSSTLALLGTLAASQGLSLGATLIWNAGTASTDFNNTANYTPSQSLGNNNLVFNTATDPGLATSMAVSLESLTINAGASGFVLGGASGLTIQNTGIIVANDTTAQINVTISENGNASTQSLKVNVGSGGQLTLSGSLTLFAKPFVKSGAGTLVLTRGTGDVRNGATMAINEGTLSLASTASLSYGSTSAGSTNGLPITLGTGTTAAVLQGSGSVKATLTTAGASQSALDPAGTLTVNNLDASLGATFKMALGTDLLTGTGTFTGSTLAQGLAFDLSGGTAGTVYTLLTYGSFSGLDTSDLLINGSGYVLDTTYGDNGWLIGANSLQVKFTAVPEPGATALLGSALVSLVAFRRRLSIRRI